MANKYEFNSDKINIFFMLVDSSGSMEGDARNVKIGLRRYQESFEGFSETDSIAVSISKFTRELYLSEFKSIKDLDTSYSAHGGTALYDAIVKGAKYLMEYVKEVTRRTKCNPRVTFILFSDGQNESGCQTSYDAYNSIKMLNLAGVTTVFIAFGEAITSDFGRELGFMSTTNVDNRETLVEFLGEKLSNSCKEQSKSLKALGTDFFSQANNSSSAGYSQASAQALEDDSWIDEI